MGYFKIGSYIMCNKIITPVLFLFIKKIVTLQKMLET